MRIGEAVYLGQRCMVMASNPGRIVALKDLRSYKSDNNHIGRDNPKLIKVISELRNGLTS